MRRIYLFSLFAGATLSLTWSLLEYSPKLSLLAQVSQTEQSGDQLLSQGISEYQQQDFTAAITAWEQALDIFQNLGNSSKESKVLVNLAAAYFSMQDYHKALDYYLQRLTILEKSSDRYAQADTLNSIGRVYFYLKQYKKSLKAYQESLEIAHELKVHLGEKVTLDNLGEVYQELGNYDQATHYFQQSLKLANDQINDPLFKAESLYNLGVIYALIEQPSLAMEYLNQGLDSLSLISEDSPVYLNKRALEAKILNHLGIAHRQLKQFNQAIVYHEESLNISRELNLPEQQIATLSYLGLTHNANQAQDQGIAYQQQSLELLKTFTNSILEIETLVNLGTIYLDNNQYQLAINYFDKALVIAEQINHYRLKQIIINNLGIALLKEGRVAELETLLNQLPMLEAEAEQQDYISLAFAKQHRNSYRTFQKMLRSQNQNDQALIVAHQENLREFQELLIKAGHPAIEEQLELKTLTLAELQKIATNQRTTIIQYSIIWDQEIYIWVIGHNGAIEFRAIDISAFLRNTGTESLSGLIAKTLGVIQAENEVTSNLYLTQLYQILIQPIASLLPKNSQTTVIIVPQDELYHVPFAALRSPGGDYLIENHSIMIAPILQGNEGLSPNISPPQPLIVGHDSNPLITSNLELEAQAVARVFNSQAILGPDANLTNIALQLPGASVIHLAAESIYSVSQPIKSGVVLAPETSGNLLTAQDLIPMDLTAKIAVVSSTEWNSSEELASQGIYKLSTAWLVAGVPRVILSLWPVSDPVTQEFWTEFYQTTITEPRKAKALRQTMLKVMKSKPAPKYWAGYLLIGTF